MASLLLLIKVHDIANASTAHMHSDEHAFKMNTVPNSMFSYQTQTNTSSSNQRIYQQNQVISNNQCLWQYWRYITIHSLCFKTISYVRHQASRFTVLGCILNIHENPLLPNGTCSAQYRSSSFGCQHTGGACPVVESKMPCTHSDGLYQ